MTGAALRCFDRFPVLALGVFAERPMIIDVDPSLLRLLHVRNLYGNQ
jgi:hypothetical protein